MKLFSVLCLVIIVSISQVNFTFAENHNQQTAHNNLRVKNSQQAAQIVKARLGGKVLKVTKNKGNGQASYRVKLVKKDGHVVSVLVNAKTGKLSGQ